MKYISAPKKAIITKYSKRMVRIRGIFLFAIPSITGERAAATITEAKMMAITSLITNKNQRPSRTAKILKIELIEISKGIY